MWKLHCINSWDQLTALPERYFTSTSEDQGEAKRFHKKESAQCKSFDYISAWANLIQSKQKGVLNSLLVEKIVFINIKYQTAWLDDFWALYEILDNCLYFWSYCGICWPHIGKKVVSTNLSMEKKVFINNNPTKTFPWSSCNWEKTTMILVAIICNIRKELMVMCPISLYFCSNNSHFPTLLLIKSTLHRVVPMNLHHNFIK